MNKKILSFIFAAWLLAVCGTSAAAQGPVIYNVIPDPLAGNYPSQPFQAQQAAEWGDRVGFAISGQTLTKVTVTMSSWACQQGNWFGGCVTTPGATFTHPITINIYKVGSGNAVGPLLATVTQSQTLPYRPSSDLVKCDSQSWYDSLANVCYHGKAANVSFDFTSQNVTLPGQVIIGIAYNTSNWGYHPLAPQPCNSTTEGCPYDSLNVAGVDPAVTLTAGTNPAPDDAYFNTQTAFWYCDGGLGGVGTFRLDAGCWTGFKPAFKVNAINPPKTKDQCKGDGWKTLTRADGSLFKNQGDCVSYTNNGK